MGAWVLSRTFESKSTIKATNSWAKESKLFANQMLPSIHQLNNCVCDILRCDVETATHPDRYHLIKIKIQI